MGEVVLPMLPLEGKLSYGGWAVRPQWTGDRQNQLDLKTRRRKHQVSSKSELSGPGSWPKFPKTPTLTRAPPIDLRRRSP